MRPSRLTALCAARRAAAEHAAAEAAVAVSAAAALAAEEQRQDRQAATEQRRQDRARAASVHNLGRQQLDCFEEEVFQHNKLQKLTDPRTKRLSIGLRKCFAPQKPQMWSKAFPVREDRRHNSSAKVQQLLLQGQGSAATHQTLPTLLERVVERKR